jgi:hypothetical protein
MIYPIQGAEKVWDTKEKAGKKGVLRFFIIEG